MWYSSFKNASVIFRAFVVLLSFLQGSFSETIKCATPNSLEGHCIYIDECPPLQAMANSTDLAPEDIIHLRRSQCDYSDLTPRVCCPVSMKARTFIVPEHQTRTPTSSEEANDDGDTPIELINRFKPDEGLPGLHECGTQIFDNRIFNGEFTAIDEFPWMALLEYKSKRINGRGFACGGALISHRFVLTAAHCVSGQNEQALGGLVGVRLGEHNIETDPDCDEIYPTDCAESPIDSKIEEKIVHPMYDEDSIHQQHDIAILKLEQHIKFTDFIRPICLSSQLPPAVHDPGHIQYVAGWGQTEFGRSSPVKKKLKVPLVDEPNCASKYRPFNIRISKRQLCAGGIRDQDSCMGDSGGPLMVQATSNVSGTVWYMTGIVSIGPTPCASNKIPGIYTKVLDYLPWILDIVRRG